MSVDGSRKSTYNTLLSHIEHHNVRKWLMRGVEDEDANTIRWAVERLTDEQLNRRFARMLTR
jgi:hypothetical protein